MSVFAVGAATAVSAGTGIAGSMMSSSASKKMAKEQMKMQKEQFNQQMGYLKDSQAKAEKALANPYSGMSWQGQQANDNIMFELGLFKPPVYSEYMSKGGPGAEAYRRDWDSYNRAVKDPNYGRARKQYSNEQWQNDPLYSAMPDQAIGDELMAGPGLDERGPNMSMEKFEKLYGFRPFPTTDQEILDQDPSYRFTKQQGMRAVNAQAAKMGQLYSGGRDKAIANYVTGLANQTYGDIMDRHLKSVEQFNNRQMGKFAARQEARLGNWQGRAGQYLNQANLARQGFGQAYDRNMGFRQSNLDNLSRVYGGERDIQQNAMRALAGVYTQGGKDLAGASQTYTSNATDSLTRRGNAEAAGYAGIANSINSSIGNGLSAYLRTQGYPESKK